MCAIEVSLLSEVKCRSRYLPSSTKVCPYRTYNLSLTSRFTRAYFVDKISQDLLDISFVVSIFAILYAPKYSLCSCAFYLLGRYSQSECLCDLLSTSPPYISFTTLRFPVKSIFNTCLSHIFLYPVLLFYYV